MSFGTYVALFLFFTRLSTLEYLRAVTTLTAANAHPFLDRSTNVTPVRFWCA